MTQLVSTLTCPKCGGLAVETMPTDACRFFYDCRHCGEMLRPTAGTAACSAPMAMFRARRSRKRA